MFSGIWCLDIITLYTGKRTFYTYIIIVKIPDKSADMSNIIIDRSDKNEVWFI